MSDKEKLIAHYMERDGLPYDDAAKLANAVLSVLSDDDALDVSEDEVAAWYDRNPTP